RHAGLLAVEGRAQIQRVHRVHGARHGAEGLSLEAAERVLTLMRVRRWRHGRGGYRMQVLARRFANSSVHTALFIRPSLEQLLNLSKLACSGRGEGSASAPVGLALAERISVPRSGGFPPGSP